MKRMDGDTKKDKSRAGLRFIRQTVAPVEEHRSVLVEELEQLGPYLDPANY
jgi:hypothetical protein